MCAGALAPERLSALARLCVAGLGFLSMAVCVACLRTVVFFVYWCALLSAARADAVLWTVPWPLPWGRLSRFVRWASLLLAVLGRGRVGPGLCFVGSESPYTRAQIGLPRVFACLFAKRKHHHRHHHACVTFVHISFSYAITNGLPRVSIGIMSVSQL